MRYDADVDKIIRYKIVRTIREGELIKELLTLSYDNLMKVKLKFPELEKAIDLTISIRIDHQ
jgi:hypothetical protein